MFFNLRMRSNGFSKVRMLSKVSAPQLLSIDTAYISKCQEGGWYGDVASDGERSSKNYFYFCLRSEPRVGTLLGNTLATLLITL